MKVAPPVVPNLRNQVVPNPGNCLVLNRGNSALEGPRPQGDAADLIISDACRGLVEAAAEVFPNTDWQRCIVHFYRNVFGHVPNGKVAEVARMLKAIHAQERAAKRRKPKPLK